MTELYTIKGTLVKGNGHSYNLNNRFDALQLCKTLNGYENEKRHESNYEKLKQQVIALQMDLKAVQADLDKIKELLE